MHLRRYDILPFIIRFETHGHFTQTHRICHWRTGFIGSHLVERLLSKGYTVRCLIRNPKKLGYLKDLPIEIFDGDLFSTYALEKELKAHSTSFICRRRRGKEESRILPVQPDGTRNVIETTARVCPKVKKFIHISSQTAVGPGGKAARQ